MIIASLMWSEKIFLPFFVKYPIGEISMKTTTTTGQRKIEILL